MKIRKESQKRLMESVRKHMIEIIESQSLPVGFVRDEADSYYGIRVNKDRTISAIGYARDYIQAAKLFTIDDLNLIDLAYLLDENAVRDKKLNDWNWEE